jgi:hypothetical protein
VIDNNFGLVAPDIVEQIHHNPDGLVPHQLIISLVVAFSLEKDAKRSSDSSIPLRKPERRSFGTSSIRPLQKL